MKDVLHEIFTLEFTQTVIFYLLGVGAMILPSCLHTYGVELPGLIKGILEWSGYGLIVLAFCSYIHLGFVVSYVQSRHQIANLKKNLDLCLAKFEAEVQAADNCSRAERENNEAGT